jgi:transcriptional regulator with XRE-family HTH domain
LDDFARRAAALLRAAANDLKRDDAAADRELGLAPGEFARYASGERPVAWDLVAQAARVWPLNERDLLPIRDDAPAGVLVLGEKDSVASSRTIERAGVPYYEYRDTAMSRVASYRPEWIRMLQVVDGTDPDDPAVRWNEGHLLYQFTYFVGPVNYYYRWAGRNRCVPMTTGDSVWGVPFAPHSFTARDGREPAYILALTYGGRLVGDAQRELSVLGESAAAAFALPVDPRAAAAALLRSFLDARLTTPAELARATGVPADRVARFLDGAAEPDPAELAALAGGLGVAPRDLLPPACDAVGGAAGGAGGGVRIQPGATARTRGWPDQDDPAYELTELAGDRLHPHTASFRVRVRPGPERPGAALVTYQHQYLYVLGDRPVRLVWERAGRRQETLLAPGDSAYVVPFVPVTFTADRAPAEVLLLRIGGAVDTDVRAALGAMAAGGLGRYVAEDRMWFRADGRRA